MSLSPPTVEACPCNTLQYVTRRFVCRMRIAQYLQMNSDEAESVTKNEPLPKMARPKSPDGWFPRDPLEHASGSLSTIELGANVAG